MKRTFEPATKEPPRGYRMYIFIVSLITIIAITGYVTLSFLSSSLVQFEVINGISGSRWKRNSPSDKDSNVSGLIANDGTFDAYEDFKDNSDDGDGDDDEDEGFDKDENDDVDEIEGQDGSSTADNEQDPKPEHDSDDAPVDNLSSQEESTKEQPNEAHESKPPTPAVDIGPVSLARCQRESLRHLAPGTDKGPRLQFLHIPKAGGTAVQLAIKYQWKLKPYEVCQTDTHDTGIMNSSFTCNACAMRSSVLIGHRGFGYCSNVEHDRRRKFVVFTVLRTGWTRIVSHYDYSFLKWPGQLGKIFGNRDDLAKNIKEYARTTDVVEPGERYLRLRGQDQVRFLCGYECDGPNAENNATITLDFMMERAKANLNKTAMIGVEEALDDVIPQLKFHLTIAPPSLRKWQVINTLHAGEKAPLDDEAIAILKEWAKPDQELYDMAVRLFHEKTALARKCHEIGF